MREGNEEQEGTPDESSDSGPASLPPGVYIPPDERIATFFLLLEEQIHWRAEIPSIRLRPIDPRLYLFLDLPHGGSGGAGNGDASESGVESERPNYLRHNMVLESVLTLHQVDADLAQISGLDTLMQVSSQVSGAVNSGESSVESPSAQRTVVEVEVPLVTLNSIRLAEGQDSSQIDRPDAEAQLISDAFDRGIDHVREMQAAYSRIMREPTTLVTRQLQPMLSPFGVRPVAAQPASEAAEWSFFLAHENFSWRGMQPQLTDEQCDLILTHMGRLHALSPYMELVDQAKVAHRSRGNTREALAMLGAASEALVGTVLRFLLWETNLTPEEAARSWPMSLDTRVKHSLPSFLGGDWRRTGDGSVAGWYADLMAVRHRVIHAGYRPSEEECQAAFAALDRLVVHLVERLATTEVLRKYPRTAWLLFGKDIEKRRGGFPGWFRSLQEDPDEVHWEEVSRRWAATHERILVSELEPRSPSVERAILLHIIDALDRSVSYILQDEETGMACEVQVDEFTMTQREAVESFLQSVPEWVVEPVVTAVVRNPELVIERVGPWVELYHLNPLLPVMLDKSDLERAWPLPA